MWPRPAHAQETSALVPPKRIDRFRGGGGSALDGRSSPPKEIHQENHKSTEQATDEKREECVPKGFRRDGFRIHPHRIHEGRRVGPGGIQLFIESVFLMSQQTDVLPPF